MSERSGNYNYINQACYIDGIRVNKMARAVMRLNNLDKLSSITGVFIGLFLFVETGFCVVGVTFLIFFP